jgi:hypothetical protein
MAPSKIKIIFITLFVIWVASGYYFWEKYLYEHYIGAYDQYGLPIQQSNPGFDLLIKAWYLWTFPMISLLIPIGFWIFNKVNKFKANYKILTKKFYKLEIETNSLKYELKTQKSEFDKKEQDYLLSEQRQETAILRERQELNNSLAECKKQNQKISVNYQQLEKNFHSVLIDYRKSLQFTEKLLTTFNFNQDES